MSTFRLCTVSDVRAAGLNGITDARILPYIDEASAILASSPRGFSRDMRQASRTEIVNVSPRGIVYAPNPPVVSIATVETRPSFSDDWLEVTEYAVLNDYDSKGIRGVGRVQFSGDLYAGEGTLRVTWTTGIATTTEALPTDVRLAAARMAVFCSRRGIFALGGTTRRSLPTAGDEGDIEISDEAVPDDVSKSCAHWRTMIPPFRRPVRPGIARRVAP